MKFTKLFTNFVKQNYKPLAFATGVCLLNNIYKNKVFNTPQSLEFTLQNDNSIMLEANTINNDTQQFKQQLEVLLENIKQQKRKCAWLKLNTDQLHHLEFLIKEKGFKIHHALKGYIMLTKWLDESQEEFYIPYATHNAGCGGVVINDQNEVLLVKEKKGFRNKLWSFPGGRVDLGEAMHEAALREVKEETGLVCQPKDLLLIRDTTRSAYGRPDIYFLFILKPLTDTIKICSEELADYKWVPLSQLDKFKDEQQYLVPLQQYTFEKLFQLYQEGYRFSDEKRVQEFYTQYNNSNYNIYMPTRGFL